MKKISIAMSIIACTASFDSGSAITMAKVSDIDLGFILAGPTGRQWILSTTGTISGSGQADYILGASAGEIIVTDTTAPSAAQIEAVNISTMNGLSVNQIFCSYDNGPQTRCDQPGYLINTGMLAKSLKLGIDVESTQYHFGGESATVDFEVSITYQ